MILASSNVLPANAQALTSCSVTSSQVPAGSWFIGTEAAVLLDSALVLLGQPRFLLRGGQGSEQTVDSSIAGFVVRGARAPRTLGAPAPGLVPVDLRAMNVSEATARALFRSATSARGGHVSFRVWTAWLTTGGFRGVTELGEFLNPVKFSRELSGDMVKTEGGLHFAMAQNGSEGRRAGVVLFTIRDDSVRTEMLDPGFAGIGYVSLASHGGTLWMALTASEFGANGSASLWVTTRASAGWTAPQLVAAGGDTVISEPRLLSTSNGLLLAWTEELPAAGTPADPPSAIRLRWKDVARANQASHSMLARWPIVRGAAPFQHILSVQRDDSTALVLQLSPSGAQVIASLENRGWAPLVAGSADRPLAVTIVSSSSDSVHRVALVDLSCGLKAMHPPPPS